MVTLQQRKASEQWPQCSCPCRVDHGLHHSPGLPACIWILLTGKWMQWHIASKAWPTLFLKGRQGERTACAHANSTTNPAIVFTLQREMRRAAGSAEWVTHHHTLTGIRTAIMLAKESHICLAPVEKVNRATFSSLSGFFFFSFETLNVNITWNTVSEYQK